MQGDRSHRSRMSSTWTSLVQRGKAQNSFFKSALNRLGFRLSRLEQADQDLLSKVQVGFDVFVLTYGPFVV